MVAYIVLLVYLILEFLQERELEWKSSVTNIDKLPNLVLCDNLHGIPN